MFFKHVASKCEFLLFSKQTALLHRAAESADLIAVSLRGTLLCLLESKISKDAGCVGGWTAPAASMITPSRPRAVTLCDFVFVRKKG